MMRSLVSLVLLSAVASSLGGDAYSSQRRELAARIIGGSDVAPNTYPFFAFVFVETEDGSVPCGGSLIHTDIILTAASCILSETIEVAVNLTSFDASEGSYSRSIAQVLVHPEFNIELLENDIALLKLEGGIPEITPAVYNRMTGTPVEGNSVTVVGFGSLTEEDNNFPRVLQQVEVEVHNFDTCNIAYEGMLDPNRQLCGGVQEGGKDACRGDSGGPMLSGGKVVGLVSGGNGCAQPDFPGFYTRVSFYRDFIEEGICELTEDPPPECNRVEPAAAPVMAPVAPSVTPPVDSPVISVAPHYYPGMSSSGKKEKIGGKEKKGKRTMSSNGDKQKGKKTDPVNYDDNTMGGMPGDDDDDDEKKSDKAGTKDGKKNKSGGNGVKGGDGGVEDYRRVLRGL